MTTYKKSGVNALLMDKCSELAYRAAKQTFSSRKNSRIGRPVEMDGGFTGAIDMGNYYLTQNEDGVGTKMMAAELLGKYDTMGYDLCAMVADDAICVGAEVISITNTIDTSNLSPKVVLGLMKGLAKACREQKILIPGGEIAVLNGQVNGYVWNATAVGIVEKKKFIDGNSIKIGDAVIGLQSPNFRSNGLTLVRYILKKYFGAKWHKKAFVRGKTKKTSKTWGKTVLEPSVIFHNAVLGLLGRFGEKPKVRIKGIAHITGGGLPGNAERMFGKKTKGLGIVFDNLFEPPAAMLTLQKIGKVSDREAYETWNMGTGMILVADEPEKTIGLLKQSGIKAKIVGKIVEKSGISISICGALGNRGKNLFWK